MLLNQCLHNLDTLQWLCGMPARVREFCQLGRFNHIEVEDNATAYMEWPGGATGTFISSTGEAPGTNRFEVVATRGKLVLENDRITLARNDQDMIEFSKSARQGFVKPQATISEITFENAACPHAMMVQNFVNAILDGEALVVPGEEGLNSVELANSMVYSSLLDRTIELPMDAAAWEMQLHQLIANSRGEKKVAHVSADDFASSFRK